MKMPSLRASGMKGKAIKLALTLALVLPFLGLLHFYLPRSVVVEVENIYTKRMDNDSNLIGQTDNPHGATRDVYFISTTNPDTNSPDVFRNEDTGWGFPWYFKFNSADLEAKAAKIARSPSRLAKITYYGFRINILSMFPNVVSIEEANADTSTFPVGRTIFGVLALGIFGYGCYWFRRLFRRTSSSEAV